VKPYVSIPLRYWFFGLVVEYYMDLLNLKSFRKYIIVQMRYDNDAEYIRVCQLKDTWSV